MKRESKSLVVTLLSGKKRRLIKSEITCVQEQTNIEGGVDVMVFMVSKHQYIVQDKADAVRKRIFNKNR